MGAIKQFSTTTVTVTDITSANATDLATSQTLANELKTDVNLILTALRAHNIVK